MRYDIILINISKIIGFAIFLRGECLLIQQGLEYKFHYIIIINLFILLLIVTGIYEFIKLYKLNLSQISFYWIFPIPILLRHKV